MVTVSSAFISSRRERIIFRVLSASFCAFKAAAFVDVLRVLDGTGLVDTGLVDRGLVETDFFETDFVEAGLDDAGFAEPDLVEPDLGRPDFGKTDLDNTDVARDHSFHCIAKRRIRRPPTILRMWG